MKHSRWPCRPRAINLVTVVTRNSYQPSNTDHLILFAKCATMVISNMLVGSIMSAVPSMGYMSLYDQLPLMACSTFFSVSTRSELSILADNKLS